MRTTKTAVILEGIDDLVDGICVTIRDGLRARDDESLVINADASITTTHDLRTNDLVAIRLNGVQLANPLARVAEIRIDLHALESRPHVLQLADRVIVSLPEAQPLRFEWLHDIGVGIGGRLILAVRVA